MDIGRETRQKIVQIIPYCLPDGTLRDTWKLPHAYWEAKDTDDDLDAEIEKKKTRGYPLDNIIFEDTQTTVLYQDGYEAFRSPVRDKDRFANLLTRFVNHEVEPFENFEAAITSYGEEIRNIASSLKEKIEAAHNGKRNKAFKDQFEAFMEVCRTPQEIVDFMCAAVEEVLQDKFGKKLGDDGVYLIDPATGTGNFVINILRRAFERNPRNFEQFYRERLFANEVMLMPYYIASLNIEHEFYELTGKTEPFEGIYFVDTLDLAKGRQMQFSFMPEENTKRVQRQQDAPITVIISNPPYNTAQLNENDNNQNRTYEIVDSRVRETYGKDSTATLNRALYDLYVKFFRWATDRLQDRDGIFVL